MTIKHPVLKYYGSKFRIAQWIIEHFPAHRHYVEAFGGAANVLLLKPPSKMETYNDLNDHIVNFFRILREKPDELIYQINLTPYARKEFEFCISDEVCDDPIEKARRLYYRLWMSYQSSMKVSKGNWRRHKNGKRAVTNDINPSTLFQAAMRLKNVQIESRNAFQLIKEMDSSDTLFYLDPPYVLSTRVSQNSYSHEMTNADHREFAELLYDVKGFVIVSWYPSEIYQELFENKGWKRVDKEAVIMSGGKRTECLWLSPRTFQNLDCQRANL